MNFKFKIEIDLFEIIEKYAPNVIHMKTFPAPWTWQEKENANCYKW